MRCTGNEPLQIGLSILKSFFPLTSLRREQVSKCPVGIPGWPALCWTSGAGTSRRNGQSLPFWLPATALSFAACLPACLFTIHDTKTDAAGTKWRAVGFQETCEHGVGPETAVELGAETSPDPRSCPSNIVWFLWTSIQYSIHRGITLLRPALLLVRVGNAVFVTLPCATQVHATR
jgi:hypothetical protein